MKKIIALYKTPEDPDAFIRHYRERHMPLAASIPGLTGISVTRIANTLVGDTDNFLLAELRFESDEAFAAAMKTPEFQATGQDVRAFASGIATIMIGEDLEA